MWPFLLKILWVDKNWYVVNFRTKSDIDTNLSVQFGAILNNDESEKTNSDIFTYINGSRVYPWKSSFLSYSNNVAINKVNDLRPTFDMSYICTKRVYTKVHSTMWRNSHQGIK